jgi:hypothetical protein
MQELDINGIFYALKAEGYYGKAGNSEIEARRAFLQALPIILFEHFDKLATPTQIRKAKIAILEFYLEKRIALKVARAASSRMAAAGSARAAEVRLANRLNELRNADNSPSEETHSAKMTIGELLRQKPSAIMNAVN